MLFNRAVAILLAMQPTHIPLTTVFGVFEVSRYMTEERRMDSTWDSEQRAIDRARHRSVQVHGHVLVQSWTLNRPGSQLVATFVDGEPVRSPSR